MEPFTNRISVAAQESELLLPKGDLCRTLFRNARDGILVLDERGVVVEVNDAASEFLGRSAEEVIGRPLGETLAPTLVEPQPEQLARLNKDDRCLLEFSLLKKEGDLVVLELSASRIESESGIHYLGILRDVSARRRVEEEVRRRNKELFVINAIGAVISRSLDPERVLTNGLEKVLTLLDIEAGFIVLRPEGTDRLELAVHHGLSSEFVEEYSRRPLRVGEGITGHVFVTGLPLHSRDASTDSRVTREVVRRDRIKSSLNIPLVATDRILGVMMVASFGIREFSTWDIDVLTIIANQIGVALENSRLYRDVKQRSREVLSLLNLSTELNRNLDTDGLLNLVAESARALVPCDRAAAAFFGAETAESCLAPAPMERSRVVREEPLGEAPVFDQTTRLDEARPCSENMAVPIVDSRGNAVGLIELYGPGGRTFTPKDADLIAALAAQASIAFEKSRLFEEMEKEMEFVANIVDDLASGLIATDAEGVIRRTNPRAAEMIGLPADEVRGQKIQKWLPTKGLFLDLNHLPRAFESELIDATGRRISVKVLGSLQVDDTGAPLGTILVLEDLEEVRRSKNKEKERERLATIGEVAAGIAHEIRNPLFGISSVAQILKMEETTGVEQQPLLDAMMGEVERINGLVEDLLCYGRPSTLNLTSVDLRALWGSIVLLATSAIKKHDLRVSTTFDPATPAVIADPERLRQVFLNLLRNAIEATSPEGRIGIEVRPMTREDRDGCMIEVHDGGCGMQLEVQHRVFDLFFSRKRGGSGLGLSICRKIVEDHGGHIEVSSTPELGSTFRVWLPLDPSAPGERGAR